jgi:hypothetical protein
MVIENVLYKCATCPNYVLCDHCIITNDNESSKNLESGDLIQEEDRVRSAAGETGESFQTTEWSGIHGPGHHFLRIPLRNSSNHSQLTGKGL